MGIFGTLKSRKSYSSDTSNFSKHKPDPANRNRNLEASDVIGASPDFGPSTNNRSSNYASDSASVRSSRSSKMKKLFGSTRRKGAQSIDAGSPSQSSPSRKPAPSADYFNGSPTKQQSRVTLSKPATTPGSTPVVISSAVAPALSTPTGAGGSFADAVGQDLSGGLASPTTPGGGPRPSELFAGKGVQWNQIDLTSRDITKPVDSTATTNVDMQKFLKERRQWIPTFKDSETVEEDASINLPKNLQKFSFETPPEVQKSSAGLKSLKDLEDTHKRKAALLDPVPLATATNGTIFEEAAPSTSGTDAVGGAKVGQKLPPPPAAPSRNQSFRTSAFAASSDTSERGSGSLSRKPAPTLSPNGASGGPSSSIPQRRSSVRKELSELQANEASEGQASQAQETTEGTLEQGNEQVAAAAAQPSEAVEATHESSSNVATGDRHGEMPPRPPKNGSRPPSRQTSASNIKQSTAEAEESEMPKAVASLQNAIPGMGEATTAPTKEGA